ncbi:MAG: Uma2 family endonuclease [Treponema sp.]|jgi:Uma2 family endonuclease|nr:Uma2 family endonuclease [Treponema sp.]
MPVSAALKGTFTNIRKDDTEPRYRYLVEVIGGVVYAMSAPSTKHQRVVGKLYGFLLFQLMGHPCEPFVAPYDVVLFPEQEDAEDYVLEPDVLVVCDSSKIHPDRCYGAPDFIIEVLSPSNPEHDLDTKRGLYEKARVREYWVVDPEQQWLRQFRLNPQGRFEGTHLPARGSVAIEALPGCVINFDQVFSHPF